MNSVSYPNFRSWQAQNSALSNVGIYTGASFNLASGDGAVVELVQLLDVRLAEFVLALRGDPDDH